MKNLNRVINIWSDLEKYYSDHTDTYKTRLECVKALVAYDDETNTTKISRIKSYLTDELQTYTQEELNDYSNLINILDGVDSLLRTKSLTAIENLNDLLNVSNVVNKQQSNITKKLPEHFFENLSPVKVINEDRIIKENENFFETIYLSKETFGDTFYLDNGKVKQMFMLEDYKNVFILNNRLSLSKLIQSTKQDRTDFKVRLCKACSELAEKGQLLLNLIFLDKGYLKIDDKIAIIEIGNWKEELKFTKRNYTKTDKAEYYSFNLTTKYDKFKVIFV